MTRSRRPASPGTRRSRRRPATLPALLVGGLAGLATSGCASGCDCDIALPAPRSAAPVPATRGVLAGFGRADITPAPGPPLAGNGFEGRQASGYRQRLYARAMVLEDAEGERLALVVADLPHLSLLLHRQVAARIRPKTGIGADRLFIAATHTHSGPGNHYGAAQYNQQASALPGLDPVLVRFLVDGIVSAVMDAYDDRAPAVAGWGEREIRGVTRNRSLEAHRANPGVGADVPETEAVDDTLRMLRVDGCDPGWTNCRPRAAFGVFPVHGTVLPPANSIVDADVHGVVERLVERAIEDANPALERGFRSRALFLLANGAEGDVSPAFDAESRCREHRRFMAGRRPAGPRTPIPHEVWVDRPEVLETCLEAARRLALDLGGRIADAALGLHRKIGRSGRLRADVRLGRAFRTVDLLHAPGLCAPRSGVSNFAGAEDARTRLYRWRILGLIPTRIEEGGGAVRRPPRGCQGEKRVGLGFLQGWLVGPRGLPTHAQLAVVRIGNGLLAMAPGELTTEAGRRVRAAIRREGPEPIEHVGLLGLANGYLQYVTTADEYAHQHYEGGSTLYGPGTLAVFEEVLASLAADLRRGADVAEVDPIVVGPGERHSYVPPITQGPDPTSIERRVTALRCEAGALSGRWVDVYPGRFRPHEGQVLEIQRRDRAGAWRRVAWDDSPEVTVRIGSPLGGRGHEWQVEWRPPGPIPPGTYRVSFTPRLGMPPLPPPGKEGRTIRCP